MRTYDLWRRSAACVWTAAALVIIPVTGVRGQAPTGPDTTSSTTEDSTGAVTAASANTITVKSRRGPFTYRLGEDVHVISADNRRLKIADVHVGQEVTIYYFQRDGQPTASRIVLLKGK